MDLPSMPSMPSVPSMPSMPSMKDVVPVQATMETVTKSASGATSTVSKYFRDAQSRTRIEQGPMASINDPQTGKSALLNLKNKVAIPQMPQMPQMPKMPQMPQMPKMPQMPQMPQMPKPPEMQQTADLGEKFINGIKAQGKQFTSQIPGSPQPMKMEVWTSKELQLPIQSTITDPKSGATSIMQMKDIVPHAKIDPSMFKIPPDFKIAPPPMPTLPKPPSLTPPKLPAFTPPKL
jgi:hypothetical protein